MAAEPAKLRPELETYSIVVNGAFNPSIVSPGWLVDTGLIRPNEGHQAEIEVIHRQATSFSTEWFQLRVLPEQFAIETLDGSKLSPLRDLAAGIFKLLEHTPLTAFGFNGSRHYKMPSETEYTSLGYHFAPVQPWRGIISRPALRSLTEEGNRNDKTGEVDNITLEPSIKYAHGVFIRANRHFEMKDKQASSQRERNAALLEACANDWDRFLTYFENVCNAIVHYKNKKVL
jgi:hypothetical protein